MPPKIKSTLVPEPMAATQPDSPEMPDTQTESEKPPKKKKTKKSAKAKGNTNKKSRKRRPSKVSLVKNAIAQKTLVHPEKVQQFIEALDSVALDFLKTKKVFRLNFFNCKGAHDPGS